MTREEHDQLLLRYGKKYKFSHPAQSVLDEAWKITVKRGLHLLPSDQFSRIIHSCFEAEHQLKNCRLN